MIILSLKLCGNTKISTGFFLAGISSHVQKAAVKMASGPSIASSSLCPAGDSVFLGLRFFFFFLPFYFVPKHSQLTTLW